MKRVRTFQIELDLEVLVKEWGKQEYPFTVFISTNDVKNKKNFEEHDAIKSIVNLFLKLNWLKKKIFQMSKLEHFKMLYLYL